ncbi:GATA transcription factor 11-like [Typha angustifolia]|uniref:GATA transcription factor 11-like n=1 Tax=Typha angustifolia TaxID=59011 RepID=UPI003C2CB356
MYNKKFMGGDIGPCGGLFDNIEDLVDLFIEEDVLIDNKMDSTPALAEPLFAPPLPDAFSCDTSVGASLNKEEHEPGPEDAELAQWWSNFFGDNTDSFSLTFKGSDSGIADTTHTIAGAEDDSLFRASSPLSVLEPNSDSSGDGSDSSSASSSSNSSEGNSKDSTLASEPIFVVPARARSKRPRPTTFSPRPHVTAPFLPPSTDAQQNPLVTSSEPESIGELRKKMKKRKKAHLASPVASGEELDAARLQVQPAGIRKCMHCGIEKTPQWRAGPMGPKTLCNACGVRYKSGRLFPEYRPAASPTFVPSLHSNSHKKVVEMRIKADQSSARSGCDLLQYIQIQGE